MFVETVFLPIFFRGPPLGYRLCHSNLFFSVSRHVLTVDSSLKGVLGLDLVTFCFVQLVGQKFR